MPELSNDPELITADGASSPKPSWQKRIRPIFGSRSAKSALAPIETCLGYFKITPGTGLKGFGVPRVRPQRPAQFSDLSELTGSRPL
jgi:hypothetical protein